MTHLHPTYSLTPNEVELKWIDFNTLTSHYCLLTQKHSNNFASSVAIDAVNLRQSEAFDIFGMKIQCIVRGTQQIF